MSQTRVSTFEFKFSFDVVSSQLDEVKNRENYFRQKK